TFFLTIVCFVTASLIGILTCAGFCSKNKAIRTIAKVYNGIIIKIPPLVMLMLFALIIMGERNNGSILIAYIGLSLFVAANLTGVFFGGVCSVADGEIEAARTIGMSKMQTFFHIMLPQIIQSIVPVYMSMFVMCMQITSVASVIGVKEFLSTTDGISNAALGIVLSIAGYFLIGTLGDFVITRMGKRKHIKSKDYLEKSEVR
ncbi:MAG: ABC transporter permease subunit, partial [Clostridia bacterium]|nr:ABC transporter permease subunit [Clostridia bacterium]